MLVKGKKIGKNGIHILNNKAIVHLDENLWETDGVNSKKLDTSYRGRQLDVQDFYIYLDKTIVIAETGSYKQGLFLSN